MRRPLCWILFSTVAILALSRPAAAQAPELSCVTPQSTNLASPCKLTASANPGQHSVTVQITNARRVLGTPIEFTVEEPGRTIKETMYADADGKASFTWYGAAGTGVKVTARARVGRRELTRLIEVQASATSGVTQRNVIPVSDSVVYGYQNGQIQAPMTVRIENFGDRCESNVVIFRSFGTVGVGSPDSVRAAETSLGCTASTWWRLGDAVGRQHLRASLADEPAKGRVLNAVARHLPRLNAGVVSTYDFRDYDTRSVTERKIQVTRRMVDSITGDTMTIVSDSTARTISVGEADSDWLTKPVVSVDFPLAASLTGIRLSLGAALETAGRDWYLGMSLLQPFRGVSQEAVGADIHGVIHFGRRDVLANPTCDDDKDLSDCRSKDKFFFPLGLGLMATFDAEDLLGAIGKVFP